MSDFTLECGLQLKNSKKNRATVPLRPMFRWFCERKGKVQLDDRRWIFVVSNPDPV